MPSHASGKTFESDHATYLRLLDTVHLLRAQPGSIELEFLLPDDVLAGSDILYGLPVRREPSVTPGVIVRLPALRHSTSP